MALLGYLLQHCSPTHLKASLLRALESLLKAVAPSEALTKQLLQQLLLNLRLWSLAPPAGQMSLQGLILKLAKVTLSRCITPAGQRQGVKYFISPTDYSRLMLVPAISELESTSYKGRLCERV